MYYPLFNTKGISFKVFTIVKEEIGKGDEPRLIKY